jgi:hypothetical protein
MKYLSLNQAAKESGRSKGTISKAISSGKLSYISKDDSGYKIDPAELFRVFPKEPEMSSTGDQFETHKKPHENTLETYKLQSEIEVLKVKLEAERKRADIFEQQADDWKDQAQKLLLKSPQKPIEAPRRFLGIFPRRIP